MAKAIYRKRIPSILFLCLLNCLLSGCGEKSYFEMADGLYAKDAVDTLVVADNGTDDSDAVDNSDVTTETLFVQVSGAVKYPGVYELAIGSRVFEAVDAAGGVTEDADISRQNQAEQLSDGQMIYIYSEGEMREAAEAEYDDGLIDLNSADETLLMTLPGIGSSKAAAIVSYRQQHGRFNSTDELMQITGIKSGVYDKVKDLITVR